MKYLEPVNFDHIRFIDVRWYNNCAIVVVFDSITKEYKAYISGENVNNGNTAFMDIEKVVAHGSYFPVTAAKELFYFDINEDLTLSQSMYFV